MSKDLREKAKELSNLVDPVYLREGIEKALLEVRQEALKQCSDMVFNAQLLDGYAGRPGISKEELAAAKFYNDGLLDLYQRMKKLMEDK